MDTKAIRDALAAATPGQWKHTSYIQDGERIMVRNESGLSYIATICPRDCQKANASLIENCKPWLQQLLDENERLQKQFDVECGLNFQLVEQIAQLQADKAVAVEALRWYADLSNYMPPKPFCMPFIEVDKGEKAIRALECGKEFEHDQYIVHCNECGDKAYAVLWERHERLYGQEGGEVI